MTTVYGPDGQQLPEAEQIPALMHLGYTETQARLLRGLEMGRIPGDVLGKTNTVAVPAYLDFDSDIHQRKITG